jgi:hypothetical protein
MSEEHRTNRTQETNKISAANSGSCLISPNEKLKRTDVRTLKIYRFKLVICTGGSAQLLGDHVIP